MRIEITTGVPSELNPNVSYVRVQVERYPAVLLRPWHDGRWYYLALDGTAKVAATQREAVEGALGVSLEPEWSADARRRGTV